MIERLDSQEKTLAKMYKLIEGISLSYTSKITKVEKKLVKNELLVLSLTEIKA